VSVALVEQSDPAASQEPEGEPKGYLERVKAAETAMELNTINEKASLEEESVGALNAAMVGARFDR
jgi:hypothetical protein